MSSKKKTFKGKKPSDRRRAPTTGRDNMVSNMSRKDYYVPDALEITPHADRKLVAALRQPVMDRRFKYALTETTALVSSNLSSATATALLTVAQGTTDITRTGDRIRCKRIWVQGYFVGNAAATGPTLARLIVVNDISNTITTALQVISHNAGFGTMGAYSRDWGDLFQVIYDTVHVVYPAATSGQIDVFHCDREIQIDSEFNAGGTTPVANNIKCFFLTTIGANFPVTSFSTTVWFEDLDA